MKEVLAWAAAHWEIVLFAISLFIDWNPHIKWNPWRSFFGWFGKALTRDVCLKVDILGKKVDKIEQQQEAQSMEHKIDEMDYVRTTVLDFANSCRQKRKHTKEEFDHIFALNDKYQDLLRITGQQNGRFEEAFAYIKGLYRTCMEENSFLT